MLRKISIVSAAAIAATGMIFPMPAYAVSDPAVKGRYGEQTDVAAAQTITVSGVTEETGVTVRAYQIMDGYYKDGKLVRYVPMDRSNAPITAYNTKTGEFDETKAQTEKTVGNAKIPINDLISSEDLIKTAGNIESGIFTADKGTVMNPDTSKNSDNEKTYTAKVEPGFYVVLVEGAADTVYNPAIVAVNITDANNPSVDASGSAVNMKDFFNYGSNAADVRRAYVKSSMWEKDMDKTIVGTVKHSARAEKDATEKELKPREPYGDTAAPGDTIHFKLSDILVPAYSDDYENPEFVISDTLQKTFNPISDLKVWISYTGDEKDNEILKEEKDSTYSVQIKDDSKGNHTFTIRFYQAFLKDHLADVNNQGRSQRPQITVTYDSSLKEDCGMNFSENLNRAMLKYSNDPDDSTSFKTEYRNTYTYTFSVGGLIDAQNLTDETGNPESDHKSLQEYTFNKVSQITKFSDFDETSSPAHEGASTLSSRKALAGAKFALYQNDKVMDADTKASGAGAIAVSTSDNNGHIEFDGLDEGTYYMKEIEAPKGYTLNEDEYIIKIDATLDKNGCLKDYTETIRKSNSTYHPSGELSNEKYNEPVTAITYSAKPTVNSDGTISYLRGKADDGTATPSVNITGEPVQIKDTKIQKLPSTGGSGIIIIVTLAGVTAAAGAIVSKRRKNAKEK